ncbi:hypothetical protein [Psychrobacter sp. DAB_AL32B]|uniref:hypothetical protein n=1 Tax=Psychrobacter sp. DAB_AL32B TaxID=1028414 RepID=UPI000B7FD405|nr:hypothetical protein [Psychrobacter sp. DAB_AL32B]OXL25168.1 hypothetical protein CAN34_04800 [Psychrobacter sp. DAB_AL32B]
MIRLSYTLKCWALGVFFYVGFYAIVLTSNPDFAKYIYILGVSTLLFPIAKRAVDVVTDFIAPHTIIFNGLLSSLLINIVIWVFTPFIIALTLFALFFYAMGVMTENIRAKP